MSLQSHGISAPLRGGVFRQGETRALAHTITADEPFAVTAVWVTLLDATGAEVVSAAPGTLTAVAANQYQLGYLWDTTGREPGDYVYQLHYEVDGETLVIPGQVTLLPQVSQLDRYQRRVRGWLAEAKLAEPQRQLDYLDLTQALEAAVSRYELDQPRRVLETVTLTAGTDEYALPSGWVPGFSQLQSVEYPVDDTAQDQRYLEPHAWRVDELRGIWRFVYDTPGAGETARLVYTTRHTLSHTEDTLPARHFEALCQYAAGQALLTLANQAAQTTGPGLAADTITYRTKQQEYLAQARELLRRAESAWGRGELTAPYVVWPYYAGHGRG